MTLAKPSRPFPYHMEVQASLRDTDMVGHVNNSVYLNWFEEIRTSYAVERLFLSMTDLGFIMASATLNYRSPIQIFEIVDLYCGPTRIGNSSWDLAYEFRARSDGRLVVDGATVQVQYDYENNRSMRLPDNWREKMTEDLLS